MPVITRNMTKRFKTKNDTAFEVSFKQRFMYLCQNIKRTQNLKDNVLLLTKVFELVNYNFFYILVANPSKWKKLAVEIYNKATEIELAVEKSLGDYTHLIEEITRTKNTLATHVV